MITLPPDQDSLLKKYNEIEIFQSKGTITEVKTINLYTMYLLWIFAPLILLYLIFEEKIYLIIPLIVFVSLLTAGLYMVNRDMILGKWVSITTLLVTNAVISRATLNAHSDFNTLMDGLFIFIFCNVFGLKGFSVGAVIITLKSIVLYYFFPEDRFPHQLIATILNSITVGITPYLIYLIARASQNIEKQKLKAQILLKQNEDLLQSWKRFATVTNTNSK